MTTPNQQNIKVIEKMIIESIVGKSAMDNWGVKTLDGDGFLETHNIAKSRFKKLATRIASAIRVDDKEIYKTLRPLSDKPKGSIDFDLLRISTKLSQSPIWKVEVESDKS